ncbi:MAG: helix-hairpin-helix domain-containing protein [Bacteroidaceae bacterium]|nr:helix-hairpin-helix domain-containing protein [Bacteroidaceae bacterium]
MWKDYFYYSRSDRRIIVLLSFVINILAVLCLFVRKDGKVNVVQASPVTYKNDSSRFHRYPKFEKRKYDIAHREDGRPVELFPFDPNTADSSQLARLGLRRFQIRNIYKYRAHKGVWHEPMDFSRLYGLSEEKFLQLLPYITIASKFHRKDSVKRDTAQFKPLYTVKYDEPTIVDLNLCDTSVLKRVPGIASGFARQIVAYRERLGGFYSVAQLSDIKGLSSESQRWFVVNKPALRKINLNKLSLNQLKSHPYINFYQARVITEHRRKHGPLSGLDDLSLYEEFSKVDIERLKHYAEF